MTTAITSATDRKFAQYELKGVPVRLAIGPRDLENNKAEIARRDTKEKNCCIDGWTC